MTTDAESERQIPPSALALTKAAFEAMPMQTAILDESGDIVWTNASWERFARENGLDGADMLGTNYLAVTERADSKLAAEAADGIRGVLAEETETFTHEYPCHSPSRQRWFEMRVYPIDGLETQHALVQHEDVTERRRRRALARERDELQTVARILSHDLKSPLNVALERSKLIDERDATHADSIETALRRMNDIIDDALFLARGADVEDPRPVDLGECAGRANDGVGVRLALADAPVVAADRSLLTQLLGNLLRNSADHAVDPGGAAPTVTVGPLDDGFYVADDGPGIDAADRESVFEAGYASGTAGGSGFGLAIVERIAAAHGWTVRLTEGDDGGARFEFSGVEIV